MHIDTYADGLDLVTLVKATGTSERTRGAQRVCSRDNRLWRLLILLQYLPRKNKVTCALIDILCSLKFRSGRLPISPFASKHYTMSTKVATTPLDHRCPMCITARRRDLHTYYRGFTTEHSLIIHRIICECQSLYT